MISESSEKGERRSRIHFECNRNELFSRASRLDWNLDQFYWNRDDIV